MTSPGTLYEWIETLPEDGRYVFSRADAEDVTDASDAAIKMTLYRLKKSGAIVSPRRDFFVVVPREYRSAGSPPASWFIDDLMRHRGRKYYVALLSAAALHGAGHQQPMTFQVITDAVERAVEVGRVRVEFHVSNLVEGAATERVQTETGSIVVSTPETTAFDLVRYPSSCGYWNNIATVLSELAEKLDSEKLAAGAERVGPELPRVVGSAAQPVLPRAHSALGCTSAPESETPESTFVFRQATVRRSFREMLSRTAVSSGEPPITKKLSRCHTLEP